jgi:hypothetical protein
MVEKSVSYSASGDLTEGNIVTVLHDTGNVSATYTVHLISVIWQPISLIYLLGCNVKNVVTVIHRLMLHPKCNYCFCNHFMTG